MILSSRRVRASLPFRTHLIVLSLLLAFCLPGCTLIRAKKAAAEPITDSFFCMDTYFTLTAYGENAEAGLAAAHAELERIDELLSTGKETSEISRINRASLDAAAQAQSGEMVFVGVSEETAGLVSFALECGEMTGGALDITMYPFSKLWGFTSQEHHVPTAAERKELLPLTGLSLVGADAETGIVQIQPGTQIDLGAVGKGYASSRAVSVLKEAGVESALVNLGGNVQSLGRKPDGSDWNIGIQDPEDDKSVIAIISDSGRAVITSGGYERYFEEDGKVYHHILDPGTGRPAESDLLSVSVISEDAALADALSTALFVRGSEWAQDFWRESEGNFELVLYTKDHLLLVSDGLQALYRTECNAVVFSR